MGVVCKPSEDTVQVPLAKWQGLLHQLPFLLAPHSLLLSSKEILAMPGSCRSRDSMLEPESLDQLSPRRMVLYREESGGNNERIGQYSYIGDDGKTYTVKYSAGVNGFRIIGGDHIPSGGQTSAQNQNVNAAGEIKEYDYEYYDDTKPSSPFVNPHDPSHHQKDLLDGNLAGLLAGRTFTTAAPLPFGVETTPRPNRFFPPGQIKLDRFPEGFNFNFKSSQ